ncbi:hypothetical protein [Prochlorothrix hollandica]|nr:hypothetical protein [Prochlorothrix hollandica]
MSKAEAPQPSAKSTPAQRPGIRPPQSAPAPAPASPGETTATPDAPAPGTDPMATELTTRPVLDLQPSQSRNLTVAGNRPVDPSAMQVSYTVSLAGIRPIMRNEVSSAQAIDFKTTAYHMNRPVAPNETEDSTKMLEYLD